MAGKLWRVMEWAKKNGELKAIDRVNVMVTVGAIKERVVLRKVSAETEVSSEFLKIYIHAANQIVGQRCPIAA